MAAERVLRGYGDRRGRELMGFELKEKFSAWGVTDCFCDFDDSLVGTKGVFGVATSDVGQILFNRARALGREISFASAEEVARECLKYIHGLRSQFSVDRPVTLLSVLLTARHLGLGDKDEEVGRASDRMARVYGEDIPDVFPGARETVAALRDSGINLVLATHASPEWTRIKLGGTGLAGCFKGVVCFDVRQPKANQWRSHFPILERDPTRVLVIGDNYWGDIFPAVSLGARGAWINGDQAFSVDSSTGDGRDFSDRVITAHSVGDVVEAILRA